MIGHIRYMGKTDQVSGPVSGYYHVPKVCLHMGKQHQWTMAPTILREYAIAIMAQFTDLNVVSTSGTSELLISIPSLENAMDSTDTIKRIPHECY